ncbi:MAG: DUF1501 domain-containing protein [Planctomycetia bacterium]|nr:DUF1501 domain-containing protein [Planctomycetia bacterium]
MHECPEDREFFARLRAGAPRADRSLDGDLLRAHVQGESRRRFLGQSGYGLGMAALAGLMAGDGFTAGKSLAKSPEKGNAGAPPDPLAPKTSHFPAKAKQCIFIFLEGAPSQIDLYDPKPKLNELNGKALPESLTKNVRFAFIKKESAVLLGSNRKFTKHGASGMEFSDFMPHIATCADDILMVRSMHTDQFNHHPAQLSLLAGRPFFGLPTIGSWMTYGLGSESQNLPGYVVLSAGRGTSGGASLWASGFLPSMYAGVLFRNQGEPVLNLTNPAGLPPALQRQGLDVMRDLNAERFREIHDPEIASRIASYELAFRMQSAAPELIDLSDETQATLDAYGIDRNEPELKASRGGGPGQYKQFSTNCLLARRLIERGVRFVSLFHASWDHHSNLDAELGHNCGMADQPVAALLKDLKQRGLLDDTLVVFAGEFGRTPLGENRVASGGITGRDHHPSAYSLWMAGGGVKGGLTYGATDELGWSITEKPVHVNDFHATLLALFGMDHLKLTVRNQGLDARLTGVGGHVIPEWIA